MVKGANKTVLPAEIEQIKAKEKLHISSPADATGGHQSWGSRVKSHPWITGGIILLVVLVIAVPVGVHFGLKGTEHHEITSVSVAAAAPSTVFPPITEAFVSFAIEFTSFPKFAGNASSPNTFSNNLLNNIGNVSGTKPYIRVGGNTQDYALYNSSLTEAVNGTFNYTKSVNYPTTVYIGPSYFESYNTWPDTKFSHGFNMGLATHPLGWASLLETVPVACKALSNGNLLWWEYGNEPDLYKVSPERVLRPETFNQTIYLKQWRNGTAAIKQALQEACPDLASDDKYGYVGPSFAGAKDFNITEVFEEGMNDNGTIKVITHHNYMGSTRKKGISLQNYLMNHTNVQRVLDMEDVPEMTALSNPDITNPTDTETQIPIVLNEANSLTENTYGPPGLLGTFGSALWTFDYMLYCASIGFSRVHMQLGNDFRYSSWQPITTSNTSISTLPPYYGNIAVAAMLGNISAAVPKIAEIDLNSSMDSAYATYVNGTLARIAVMNLREWNSSATNNVSITTEGSTRPSKSYTFSLPVSVNQVGVQRLAANGSDARTGITWDGWSYDYELDEGRGVRMANVTVGETINIKNGMVTVVLEDSSAAVLNI